MIEVYFRGGPLNGQRFGVGTVAVQRVPVSIRRAGGELGEGRAVYRLAFIGRAFERDAGGRPVLEFAGLESAELVDA